MFFEGHTVPVRLREVYMIKRNVSEYAVNAKVLDGAPHTMQFTVSGADCEMVLDGQTAQTATFALVAPARGYISLVSNASVDDHGAFRRIRVTAGGETLIDLDFSAVKNIEELETFFVGYYFPNLEWGRTAMEVPISHFWEFNERGYLRCKRINPGRVATNDYGPMCLLTLRTEKVGDFTAELEYEQCWKRYGLLFGCEKGRFSYGTAPHTGKVMPFEGGFAFTGARGSRVLLGGLRYEERLAEHVIKQRHGDSVRGYTYADMLPTFCGEEERSLRMHTLVFHIHSQMQYVMENETLQAAENAVVYMPPLIPCKLRGDDKDLILRVEFECLEELPYHPVLIQPKNAEKVRRLCEELYEVWHRASPEREYRSLAVFYRILAELEREMMPLSDNASLAIRMATQYIDTYFTLPKLSVKTVAQATDVSESYLYQLFREAGHPSPKEYILNCRIRHACMLLQTGQYKVYEVAEKSGFSDAKYFLTAFRHAMGVSPRQYALQYKK